MNDSEKMRIRLTIADGIYPMTINRKDEELYRKAATMINEKVNMYRERVAGGKREDYIVMKTLRNPTKRSLTNSPANSKSVYAMSTTTSRCKGYIFLRLRYSRIASSLERRVLQ